MVKKAEELKVKGVLLLTLQWGLEIRVDEVQNESAVIDPADLSYTSSLPALLTHTLDLISHLQNEFTEYSSFFLLEWYKYFV